MFKHFLARDNMLAECSKNKPPRKDDDDDVELDLVGTMRIRSSDYN